MTNEKWVNAKELAELRGISVKQAYRQIKKMKETNPEKVKEEFREYILPKKQNLIRID